MDFEDRVFFLDRTSDFTEHVFHDIILFKECTDGILKDLYICETYVSVFIECLNII